MNRFYKRDTEARNSFSLRALSNKVRSKVQTFFVFLFKRFTIISMVFGTTRYHNCPWAFDSIENLLRFFLFDNQQEYKCKKAHPLFLVCFVLNMNCVCSVSVNYRHHLKSECIKLKNFGYEVSMKNAHILQEICHRIESNLFWRRPFKAEKWFTVCSVCNTDENVFFIVTSLLFLKVLLGQKFFHIFSIVSCWFCSFIHLINAYFHLSTLPHDNWQNKNVI